MSVSESENLQKLFAPPKRGFGKGSAIGYGWALILVMLATIAAYLIGGMWHLLTLAPLMAAVLIMACFGGVGPTIFCGILGSVAWMVFIALDLGKLGSGHGLPWKWPDAPWRFAQFFAMAIFISGSYFLRRRAELML